MRIRLLSCKNRLGFTLIELVVVVLIIGILAAVAAPKMFDTASDARDSSARHSLAIIRDAIDRYRSEHGKYPGTDEASFKAALQPFLRGPFPRCLVGNGIPDGVRVETNVSALAGTGEAGTPGQNMWRYAYLTGEFIINYSAVSGDGTRYDML